MVVRHTVSSMMFCKKGCSNGIRAWSSATAVPSLKWLSSYLKATELHYVMYRLRQDRMDVIEINLIFLKLASDYELSQSKFMSSRIQFPPWCDMLLSVGNYSVAPNNESCHRDQKQGECLMATILWPVELSPTSTIYQEWRWKKTKKKNRLEGSQTSHSSSCYEATVISESHADQSGTNLIQLLVIRPLECISVWFMVAEMKERPSGVGTFFLSHDSKIRASTDAFKLISTSGLA